jgi:hypothetical protein
VDFAGHKFLGGAGFAQNEHSGVRRGHHVNLPEQLLEAGALADDRAQGLGFTPIFRRHKHRTRRVVHRVVRCPPERALSPACMSLRRHYNQVSLERCRRFGDLLARIVVHMDQSQHLHPGAHPFPLAHPLQVPLSLGNVIS